MNNNKVISFSVITLILSIILYAYLSKKNKTAITDIGILFDVSGSMKEPFNSINNNEYNKKADELSNILNKISNRKNIRKNEKIRIFSILFGGTKELIYDFNNLLIISNSIFDYRLTSSTQKANKNVDGFCNKIKNLLSSNGKRDLYIDTYLYGNSGPSERLCEFTYNIMKDDNILINDIYESLPSNCKSHLKNKAVSIGNSVGNFKIKGFRPLGLLGNKIDEGTSNEIKLIYYKCLDKLIQKIMNKEISSRRNNEDKFKFLDGNELLNIKKNLEDKISSQKNLNVNILDLFSDYIYGGTPLYKAITLSFQNFKNQSHKNNHKYIFIISDGELNDVDKNFDYIREIRQKAEKDEIIIISIFLTSKKIPYEEKLYDKYQNHFTKGSSDLFYMSSTLDYQHPIIQFFILKGWDIPLSGECKLFVEINNSKNLNKFIDLLNEAIGLFNFKTNSNIKENPRSLMNLLSSTSINNYVNSEVINKFEAKKQNKGTCYANAISAAICISSAKIIGRPPLDFFHIREILINKYGFNGAYTFRVLDEFLVNYHLHHNIINENKARKAIMKNWPCVAKFNINERQFENFIRFFENHPKDILTKKIVNQPNEYPEGEKKYGHAVVLTHISKGYLKFLNSWGNDWGDNGYFKVENADVLGIEFSEIYWDKSDLSPDEINSYKVYMKNLEKNMDNALFG